MNEWAAAGEIAVTRKFGVVGSKRLLFSFHSNNDDPYPTETERRDYVSISNTRIYLTKEDFVDDNARCLRCVNMIHMPL